MHSHTNPAHPDHDVLLIAAHAGADLSDTQAAAASALIASCADCANLHRDLVALAAATRTLPRRARAPRDYRLTAEQAASLRRGSWLRAILRPLASAQSAARPMAAAFTSLGVAGLLVAAVVPGLLGGMAATAPMQQRDGTPIAEGAAASPGIGMDTVNPMQGGPVGPEGSPVTGKADFATDAPGLGAQGGAGGSVTDKGAGDGAVDERLNLSNQGPSLLVVGSLGFLLVGLALFGLRGLARRVR